MKRSINKIIIHCSATEPLKKFTARTIDRWHRERGWLMIGYHFVIRVDGSLEFGRPLEQAGAHCRGQNSDSIGICMIGGVDSEGNAEANYTREQYKALKILLSLLLMTFSGLDVEDIYGHREFSNKACPCFDVPAWVQENL